MAIQMTRAEYNAKYGVKADVKPTTPIKMTRTEYNAKYGAKETIGVPIKMTRDEYVSKYGEVRLSGGREVGLAWTPKELAEKVSPIQESNIAKVWRVVKTPARKSREGWQIIFDNIEPVVGLNPSEKDRFWKTFLKGLPRATITTFTDFASLQLEPEILIASGLGKAIAPVLAKTKLGQTALKIGRKDISEIIYRGRVKGMREAAKVMGEKFPELKTQFGEEGIFNMLRKNVKVAGGWRKMTPDKINKFIKDIQTFKAKSTVTVKPFEIGQKPITQPPTKPIQPVKAVKPPVTPKADIKAVKPVTVVTKKPTIVTPKPTDKLLPAKRQQLGALASKKALISKKGKFKPQYRKLAQGMFGKKIRTREMNDEQLDIMLNAVQSLPKAVYRGGRLIPPSIPKTTKLVTQEFFRRKFKQPTPAMLFTSQNYYSEVLGVAPLTRPLEMAKQEFDLEYRATARSVDEMGMKIDKIGKTGMREKLKAKIKGKPTKAVEEMRELLDKHENAPETLSPEKTKLFNWFRNLNRTMLKGINENRAKLGIPEIPYRKAYVKHVADGMAQEMLQGKYPFPEGLKYWSQKIVGGKIHNPSELRRTLSEDLYNLFSKDLIFATKSMLWTGLKEIHLSEPLRSFKEQIGALSKDMPIYENLSPKELNRMRELSVIPASTKNWLTNYVNTVIKGQETETDASVNRWVTESGVGGLMNKALTPFGKSIGTKPLTVAFSALGRTTISAVMGWRPKQLIRNKFQLFQNLALYGLKANLKGVLPRTIDKNLNELMADSLFLKSYTGIEELPKDLTSKLEQLWLAPYQWTALSNVEQSMKVAYWDTLEMVTEPKYKGTGFPDPKRTYKENKGFLYKSEKEKLLREMEFGAGVTQYSYIGMGMPQIFRYKTFTPVTRLQSWWMNYFTKFTRESIHRGLKGSPTYDENIKYPWSRRLGYLKYVVIAGGILNALGYKKMFLLGVAPTYMSPAAQVALGLYSYATASGDKKWVKLQRERAKKRIFNSWNAFVPGSLAWKDFSQVWKGEKPIKSLYSYSKPDRKATERR